MKLVEQLRVTSKRFIESEIRKRNILKGLSDQLMAAANKGMYYFETENLGCHPEEVRELLDIIKNEGVKVNVRIIHREMTSRGFGCYEDGSNMEQVEIFTFSWSHPTR